MPIPQAIKTIDIIQLKISGSIKATVLHILGDFANSTQDKIAIEITIQKSTTPEILSKLTTH